MTSPDTADMLDVREMRKQDRHPAILAAYRDLATGASFTLLNDHDPQHLREDFEVEYPGSYGWEYESREPGAWRIRITKHTGTALPRIVADTNNLPASARTADGAVWNLEPNQRDLDSNIVSLHPGGTIDTHYGPDLDVLIHLLRGDGTLVTERGDVHLSPGALLFLPRRSLRKFIAGPDGLCYLTVHRKREALVIQTSPPDTRP